MITGSKTPVLIPLSMRSNNAYVCIVLAFLIIRGVLCNCYFLTFKYCNQFSFNQPSFSELIQVESRLPKGKSLGLIELVLHG